MEILCNIKQAGSRRGLTPVPLTLPGKPGTLRELLDAVTSAEVDAFHLRRTERPFPLLSGEEISHRSREGKVSFGQLLSPKQADRRQASATALQAFEDGLVRVFLGETQLTDLDAPLSVRDGDVFTFVRLTFLSGRMW